MQNVDGASLRASHRRDDSWQDLDVFQSYHSQHHRYLTVPEPAPTEGFSADAQRAGSDRDARTKGRGSKVWAFVRVAVLLAMVGASTALIAASVDAARWELRELRLAIVGPTAHLVEGASVFSWRSWATYVLFSVVMALASCWLTHAVCPEAAGSGVPEIKTMLSGVVKPSLLSVRALFAKVFGLVLALAAGLSVGQEGPTVHMACAIADVLMRNLGCFRDVVANDATRLDILGAAAAGGVAASFGTPFGGAIFSIEITAATYNVAMLPLALWCALVGVVLLQLLGLSRYTTIIDVKFLAVSKGIEPVDLVLFILLGAVCGLLGCAFVRTVATLARYRNAIIKRGFRAVLGPAGPDADARALLDVVRPSLEARFVRIRPPLSLQRRGASYRSYDAVARIDEEAHEEGSSELSPVSSHGASPVSRHGALPAPAAPPGAPAWARPRSWALPPPLAGLWCAGPSATQRDLELRRKLALVLAAMLIVAPLVYGDMLYGLAWLASDRAEVTEILFAKEPMANATHAKLFGYVPYKLAVTALSVTLPLPAGVFKPTFICGAAIGRAVGELLHRYGKPAGGIFGLFATQAVHDQHFEPWEYAVIGASAFAAGVTRALSTAVIFLELAGENHLRTPLLIATLVAYFIGNCFTNSIYDALADTNGAPTLQPLSEQRYHLPARDIMQPVESVADFCRGSDVAPAPAAEVGALPPALAVPYIVLDSSYADLHRLVTHARCRGIVSLPVVQDANCLALVGTVALGDVVLAVRAFADHLGRDATLQRPPGWLAGGAPAAAPLPPESGRETPTRLADSDDRLHARRPRLRRALPSVGHIYVGKDRTTDEEARAGGEGDEPSPARSRSRNQTPPRRPPSAWGVRVNFIVNHGGRALPVSFAKSVAAESFWPPVLLDVSPYQILDTMALAKVDMIFRTLKVNSAHVTRAGTLVGVITRSRLRDVLGCEPALEATPSRQVK
ncbi:chloride channel [Pelagophyceae sp. CCMP2097]|nr:chloride channel [Pelagophyceae sp. CCMP2097]